MKDNGTGATEPNASRPTLMVLSAYQTSAADFFTALKQGHVDLVVDVRLRAASQLCGFTKEKDLGYLVPTITRAAYVHDLRFAPQDGLLDDYLHQRIGWPIYRRRYQALIARRSGREVFYHDYGGYRHICLLGTATKRRLSHSEALLEILQGGK